MHATIYLYTVYEHFTMPFRDKHRKYCSHIAIIKNNVSLFSSRLGVFFAFLLSLSFPFCWMHISNNPSDNKQNELSEHARYKCACKREGKNQGERGWGGEG